MGVRLRGASFWVVLSTYLASFFVLMVGVVPRFEQIFVDMLDGHPLPWISRVIIGISRWVFAYWYLLVAGAIIVLVVLIASRIRHSFRPTCPAWLALVVGLGSLGALVVGLWLPIRQIVNQVEVDLVVEVPSSIDSTSGFLSDNAVVIEVAADGSIMMEEQQLTLGALRKKLEEIALSPDQAVILKGHASADFKSVVAVLDQIKDAGLWNVSFEPLE